MNKLLKKDHPEFFDVILTDWDFEIIEDEHAKETSFYSQLLYTIKESHREWFPDVDNFDQYIGSWINEDYVIRDASWGVERDDISELTRAKAKEIVTTEIKWVPVEETKESIESEKKE